jgi:hypothetical protein
MHTTVAMQKAGTHGCRRGGSVGWLDPGLGVMGIWLIQVMDLWSITLGDE